MRIKKITKKKMLSILFILVIGITILHYTNYNTVRAGGQIRGLRREKFWNGDRFYLILERDNGAISEYEISEKDYYMLGEEYIIVFMDGHIESLNEFEAKKNYREIESVKSIQIILSFMIIFIIPIVIILTLFIITVPFSSSEKKEKNNY
jgi:energy-coupling factor transporter transmembrane protein EcfT